MRTALCTAFLSALVLAPVPGARAAPVPKGGPPRLIAVSCHKEGLWGVYVVHPDTGESKRLTPPKSAAYGPSWAPDGSRLAFSARDGGHSEVWTMKPDGTDPRQLTKTQGDCSERHWSPDGKRIAFVLGKDGKDRICVADVATGKVTELSDGSFPCEHVAWSPNGERLLYARRVGKYALHTVAPDGTDDRQVSDPLGGRYAAWSPDGTRLVYTTFVADARPGWHLFTVGADGKGKKQLTAVASTNGYALPQWSPDGTQLVFGVAVDGAFQIATMSAAGGEMKFVTSGARSHTHPRWSPDGKTLGYVRTKPGERGALVVSDPDGTNAKVLLANVDGPVQWKPK